MVKTLPHKIQDIRIQKQWPEILYKRNKKSKVTINTPFGETENIETEEIIKQAKT